jgi:antitoxin component YwqK of YwqJK toxin-antitoxin module
VKDKEFQQIASQIDQSEKKFIKDNPSDDKLKSIDVCDENQKPYSPPLVAGSHDSEGNVIQTLSQNTKDIDAENVDNLYDENETDKKEINDRLSDDAKNKITEPNIENELVEDLSNIESQEFSAQQQPPPKDGTYECVNKDGKLSILTYKNDELTGPIQIFDKAGNLELDGIMEKGQLNGICKIYDNGILKSETMMSNNEPHGMSKQFDEHGTLIAEINFENGKKQGDMTQFHSNGEISAITTFTDNKMNGSFKSYSTFGELSMRSEYKNDKLHGLMENFYVGIDGNGMMRESNYENGLLTGKEILYHSSGYILSESYYENGQLAEPIKSYPSPKN